MGDLSVEFGEKDPWVQVIGTIAIHQFGREPRNIAGSSRTLLAMLVAAGRDGLSHEELARAYWDGNRPVSWNIALRAAVAHLRTLLPTGWRISATSDTVQLIPGRGWIDAWRLAEEPTEGHANPPTWSPAGRPFGGIAGIAPIDAAAERLIPLLESRPSLIVGTALPPKPRSHVDRLLDRTQQLRRAIILGAEEDRAAIARAALDDDKVHTSVIVGDRDLLLPLGPFAVAFPDLRNELELEQGVVNAGAIGNAWRVVADSLAIDAAFMEQRLIVANAHELDATSLRLASWLIERGPLTGFTLLLMSGPDERDLRWLDFVKRASTAGCHVINASDPDTGSLSS